MISGGGPATISQSAYRTLAVGATTLSQVLAQFGAPTSRSSLESFLGSGAFSSLIGSQPSGESCAYYLVGSDPKAGAFQLCFNCCFRLADKAIVSSSG